MSSNKKTFTLLELASSIQRAINSVYSNTYWVKAEMHKLNKTIKGHCYPELVHKENDIILAEMRGTIWKNTFESIRLNFESVVKEPLREGLTLLFQVKVNFHPLYGMGLEIISIDPNYTLGELHKEREETLRKLKQKGLLNRNQQLKLPLLPKNIAIISVESSKGLSDFLAVLQENNKAYGFNTKLFPAILNGDGAVESIIGQLRQIKKYRSFFHAVVIVRGGGGEIGMTCYNAYSLCEEITKYPLPVLTGIGHSTNLTVAEMIAYKSAITPTQLAGFFIDSFRQFDLAVQDKKRILREETNYFLNMVGKNLTNEMRFFKTTTSSFLIGKQQTWKQTKRNLFKGLTERQQKEYLQFKNIRRNIQVNTGFIQKMAEAMLATQQNRLKSEVHKFAYNQNSLLQDFHAHLENKTRLQVEQHQKTLKQMETTLALIHPDNMLQKGYSITLFNGKILSKDNFPEEGAILETRSLAGNLESSVTKTFPK